MDNQVVNNVLAFIKKQKLLVGIIAGLLLMLLIFYMIGRSNFRVESSKPNLDKVATFTPTIQINFNKVLSSKDVTVTSDPSFITSTQVRGNALILTVKEAGLTADKKYTITINSISSAEGEKITNKKLSFTAQKMSFSALDDTEKEDVVANQDSISSKATSYEGFEGLLENGITIGQRATLEQVLDDYIAKTLKKPVEQVTIYTSSLSNDPPDPVTGNMIRTFLISFDDTTYNAELISREIDDIQLVLRNQQTNEVVFDSGIVKE